MNYKSERGVVTVEAALSLMVFIPTVLTLLTIGMLCITQIRVQHALNETAKEISRYYYVLTRAGINLSSPMDEDNGQLDSVITNLKGFYSSLEEGKDMVKDGMQSVIDDPFTNLGTVANDLDAFNNGEVSDIGTQLQTIELSYNTLYTSIATIDDPIGVIKTLARTAGKTAISHAIAAAVSKMLFANCMEAGYGVKADELLQNMGIVGGLKEMNFWGSSLIMDGQSINVVCTYTIAPPFSIKFFDKYKVTQTASTRAWIYKQFD